MLAKIWPRLLLSIALLASLSGAALDEPQSERPKLPRYFTSLDPISAGVYDIKAEPVGRVFDARSAMNEKGWELLAKYFPGLGTFSDEAERRVNPQDLDDHRFYAHFATEDPGRSPIPLLSMIVSLSPSDVSARLRPLQDQILPSIKLDDYSAWKLDDLRAALDKLTQEQTNLKGVKCRAPRRQLSFAQTVQVYAMTVALLRKDTRWTEWAQKAKAQHHTVPPMPEMDDFANRLMYQLPRIVADGETSTLLLYRPGDIEQPITKGEFEERADVVTIKRSGTTFAVEQFPVYFTADQKEWNPSWIQPKDEAQDTTLMARKYEYDWTRFDGPYLWYRRDQFNGPVVYKATVRFQRDGLEIEADRFVSRRGGVMRVRRDPQYDPAKMAALTPGADSLANLLSVDYPDLELAQPMPKPHRATLEYFFYKSDGREMLRYQTSATTSTSRLYPPMDTPQGPPGTGQAAEASKSSSDATVLVPAKATDATPAGLRK